MALTTINLGQVSSIHVGLTAPTNQLLLWYDTNINLHKYYDTGLSAWTVLANSSFPNYVLTEHLVGNLWHDGKPIYRQVLYFGAFPLTLLSIQMFPAIGVVDSVISIQCMGKITGGTGYVNVDSYKNSAWLLGISGVEEIGSETYALYAVQNSGLDTSCDGGFMIVEYTKI